MSVGPTTTLSTRQGRLGHAALAAILSDMDRYLPSETINRKDYKGCRTTYGLMNTTYKRSGTSNNPEKDYKELQALERDLRRRLFNLDAAKGIPAKMMQFLDELKSAIDDALTKGVTTDFLMQGISDIFEDKPNAQPEPQPKLAKMIPDTRYKKVKADSWRRRRRFRS